MAENLLDTVSVVVPVYGNAERLSELVSRVDQTFDQQEFDNPQIVFVDDCGSKSSWQTICKIVESRDNTVAIQLLRNFGQHNAIMCGFHHASGKILITIDDDLQHEPESIPKLIQHLVSEEQDLVYGVFESKKHSNGRNLGSWLVNQFYRLIFKIPVTVTAFRAIRKELVSAILRYDLNFTYIDGLLAWNSQRIGMVEVPHHDRINGKSGYTLSKLVNLAMNVFTNFSLLPLQAVSLIGTLAACLGLGLGSWYLLMAIFTKFSVPGYASIVVAVLVLGGLQLLSLGIMGEYIGRLHLNVNRKPQFTVRNVVKNNKEEDRS